MTTSAPKIRNSQERFNSNQHLAVVGKLQEKYKLSQLNVDNAQNELEIEESRLRKHVDYLQKKSIKLSDLQEVIDSDPLPEGAQPLERIRQRDALVLEVNNLKNIAENQETAVKQKRDALRRAENDLFNADLSLNKFVDEFKDSEGILSIRVELEKLRAKRLAESEITRTKRRERENSFAIEARLNQVDFLQSTCQNILIKTKSLNNESTQRVYKSDELYLNTLTKRNEILDAEHDNRIEAVLELKRNQEVVRAKVAGQVEKYSKKKRNQQLQLEKEKDVMLSKGLNPYAEFRRKEIEEADRKKEEELKDSVEFNKAELAERLIKEEDLKRSLDINKQREKGYQKKHRDELGSHIIETRNRKYLQMKTRDHSEMLDPTGRASRVEPSQIIDIPDYSFGLGNSSRIETDSMKRITEKMRQRLNVSKDELGEYSRLLRGRTTELPLGKSSNSRDDLNNASINGNILQTLELLSSKETEIPSSAGIISDINMPHLLEKQLVQTLLVNETDSVSSSLMSQTQNNTNQVYDTAKLSKFELDSLERAKLRQRERIEEGSSQVAVGRTFKGQAFIPNLPKIEFVDFDAGKVYKKRFILTNTSYTFNSFRMLPLPDSVIDFFEISFDKPGRMSAGVSCSIDVKFTPKINQDIDSAIYFHSETGPFKVPLKCYIKRCQPRIVTQELNFGSIVVGQTKVSQIKLVNSGALPTRIEISLIGDSRNHKGDASQTQLDKNQELEQQEYAINDAQLDSRVQVRLLESVQRKLLENPYPFSIDSSQSRLVLPGYGETVITVLCAPLNTGVIENQYLITFLDVDERQKSVDSKGNAVLKRNMVDVKCDAQELPIYLAESDVDFKCTLFNRIYRKKFDLYSRGGTTTTVNIKIPPPYSDFIEVSPTTSYVQSGGKQSINVKFTPNESILHKLPYYCRLYELLDSAAKIALPVEIQVVGQEIPLFFIVKSDVCASTIKLSSTLLEFGDVYLSQNCTLNLTVENTCLIPQKIAFLNIRKEYDIQPNGGFAVILPAEKLSFSIAFRPISAIEYKNMLTLKTSFNDTYHVSAVGRGIDCPIQLDSSIVNFRPTIPGQKVTIGTSLRNLSKSDYIISILSPSPEYSWISFSPSIINLKAGEASLIEIEFFPPKNLLDCDPIKWHNEITNKMQNSPFDQCAESYGWVVAAGKFGGFSWTNLQNNPTNFYGDAIDPAANYEEWGYVGKFRIPIFFSLATKTHSTLPLPIFLCLQTAVTKPEFIVEVDNLDFGQVAVNTRLTRSFKIQNVSNSKIITLTTSILNCSGPFSIVNANKTLGPGQWHNMLIECNPMSQGLVVDKLEISTTDSGPSIQILLKVQGVNPVIEIVKVERYSDVFALDFGNVIIFDQLSKSFAIDNKSKFPVEVTIQRTIVNSVSCIQHFELVQSMNNGIPIFTFGPENVIIPENESAEVEVSFRPDRARLIPYREDFSILVGRGDTPINLTVVGRVQTRQMYVKPMNSYDEPFIKQSNTRESHEDILFTHFSGDVRKKAGEVAKSLGINEPSCPFITLEFPDPYSGADSEKFEGVSKNISQSRQFAVCCANIMDGRPGVSAGSFEYKLDRNAQDSKFFSVSNDKGNVGFGGEVVVTVTCTLPRPRGLGGLEVGSWQSFQSNVMLRGGWKPDGDEAVDICVPIILNAFVRL